VPEVFNSTYDIRTLLAASVLRDGKPLDIPGPDFVRRRLLDKLAGNEIGQLSPKPV
jgi:oleate hydratase